MSWRNRSLASNLVIVGVSTAPPSKINPGVYATMTQRKNALQNAHVSFRFPCATNRGSELTDLRLQPLKLDCGYLKHGLLHQFREIEFTSDVGVMLSVRHMVFTGPNVNHGCSSILKTSHTNSSSGSVTSSTKFERW